MTFFSMNEIELNWFIGYRNLYNDRTNQYFRTLKKSKSSPSFLIMPYLWAFLRNQKLKNPDF